MLFNSVEFLIFFPVVTALYFVLAHKYRWLLLLIASCVFYMAFIPAYIFILIVTILIDYYAGMRIEDTAGATRKLFLVMSIVSTCLVLFVFKYFNFFNSNFAAMAGYFDLRYPIGLVNIILPIGLSFHTFQSLSYVIEVYRGNQKAERHFGIYSLYVMFYPQLVAGPIERPQNLLHQLREEHGFDYERAKLGLKMMMWGLFKKIVIADRLSVAVNNVYNNPHGFTGVPLITATVFFAFQIYCDFSGYSDIAIGAAKIMGIDLMTNFVRPYHSRSVAEFWKRWHISLSTWFRDYLYISLGGNRRGALRRYFNLFVTFLVSGLWHGANWTYVVWGALNGFYMIFAMLTSGLRRGISEITGINGHPYILKFSQVAVTFALTCFAWLFFRANSLSDSFYIISHLFSGAANLLNPKYLVSLNVSLGINKVDIILAFGSLAVLEAVHLAQGSERLRLAVAALPWEIRWGMNYSVAFSILMFGVFNSSAFIYFQF